MMMRRRIAPSLRRYLVLRLVERRVAHNSNTRFKTMNVKSVLDILVVEEGHHGRGGCSPLAHPSGDDLIVQFRCRPAAIP